MFKDWRSRLVRIAFICFVCVPLYAEHVDLVIPKYLDFGVVETNQGKGSLMCQLPIRNTSSKKIVVSKIVAACSCITIQQTLPLTIQPSDTALINLKMLLTAADFGGREIDLLIKSDSEAPMSVVRLKGKSDISPYIIPSVINFGLLKPGETSTKRFRVFVPTSQSSAFLVKDVMARKGSLFSAKIISQISTKSRSGYNLVVATIDLQYDGMPIPLSTKHETLSIPIEGQSGLDVSVIWN